MKTIVLIEDDLDIRETTSDILELAGYQVFTAKNGKEGIELVRSKKPDLILCDIMMPQLDGYGVLNILNRDEETSGIPLIFLTAKAEKGEIRKGMNLGADDYITKPFEETELLTAVEIRIQRSESFRTKTKPALNAVYEFIDGVKGVENLKELSGNKKTRSYKKKEIIYREEDNTNYLYFILKGKVKCVKTDYYGKYLVNDLYQEGEFVGYTSLLDEVEYQETAIAMEDTKLIMIPKQEFLDSMQKNKGVASTFIKMLSENILNKERRLLQLAYSPLRERLASTLIDLTKKKSTLNTPSTELIISREDLASIVGTAKESLIRTLSELKKEGLVETEGQKIKILDERGLKKTVMGL